MYKFYLFNLVCAVINFSIAIYLIKFLAYGTFPIFLSGAAYTYYTIESYKLYKERKRENEQV